MSLCLSVWGKGCEAQPSGDSDLLIAQLLLLPVYLGLFLGADAAALVQVGPFIDAFIWLIAGPLALAWLTQYRAARHEVGQKVDDAMAWLPVPFMALVLFIVFSAVTPQIARRPPTLR